jgi:hypothetical protein
VRVGYGVDRIEQIAAKNRSIPAGLTVRHRFDQPSEFGVLGFAATEMCDGEP